MGKGIGQPYLMIENRVYQFESWEVKEMNHVFILPFLNEQ